MLTGTHDAIAAFQQADAAWQPLSNNQAAAQMALDAALAAQNLSHLQDAVAAANAALAPAVASKLAAAKAMLAASASEVAAEGG